MMNIKNVLAGLALGVTSVTTAWSANAIKDVEVTRLGGDVVVKVVLKDAITQAPKGFSVANPPRLAFDFPDTVSDGVPASKSIRVGDLTSMNLVPAQDRLRMVLNLARSSNYETRIQSDNTLLIIIKPPVAAEVAGTSRASTGEQAKLAALRDITFRRGKDGEGRVIIDFADSGAPVDVKQQGTSIVVDLPKSSLPDSLRRKLDVTDFATPVVSVAPQPYGDGTRITIAPKGLWEHNAYQTDQQLIVEVKPIIEDPNKLVQGSKIGYQGPLVSINYANGDVRALLRLMAEELGLDAVISETVTGSITLVLKDVPADQVMDIIFKQKGLDMRKSGKVILIAPREELALREKLDFEAKQQISELEPLGQEVFPMSYQRAVNVARLLQGLPPLAASAAASAAPPPTTASTATNPNRMLSKRGSATADNQTNILFVNDTPSKLEEIRRFIKTIDVSNRQVLIEARVVEASDNFNKDLGVRMSFLSSGSIKPTGSGTRLGGGLWNTTGQQTGTTTANPAASVSLLPITTNNGNYGSFALSLFNSSLTRILNLELAALETDGRGKLISSPKVVTGNNVEANIEDGYEVPYETTTTVGVPPTITFKKVKLSLKTTPQITPEGRVKMKLEIAKDEPDWTRAFNGKNPPIKSTQIQTDVVVDNGGTVVIGGVFIVRNETTTDRIPFFGDLPYIGFLFKAQTTDIARRELLIFITPRVLNEQLELK